MCEMRSQGRRIKSHDSLCFFFYNTSSEEVEKRPRGVSDQVENLMKIESRPSVVQPVVYPEEDVNLFSNQ